MKYLLALIYETATRHGITAGRTVIKVGRATVEIVVRVFLKR